MIDYNEMVVRLTQWSQWVGSSNAPNGYAQTQLGNSSGGNGSSYEFDSKMLAVDNAVQFLKQHAYFDYRLIKLKYLYGYSYNRIADKLTKERKGKKVCDKSVKDWCDVAVCSLMIILNNTAKK